MTLKTFSLPPDDRVAGVGNPPADMDAVVDALIAMGVNSLIVPSGDTSGAADTTAFLAAQTALTTFGGSVIGFTAGTFYLTCGQAIITTAGIRIVGAGKWATTISGVGTGDVLRYYTTTTYAPGDAAGGGIEGLTIDGVNCGNGSAGVHAGDVYQLHLDVSVRRFQGTGSIGVHLDNNYFWTEQITGAIHAEECTNHVVFDNSANTSGSATGSFDRAALDIYLDCKNKGNGIVLQNGAFITNGRLTILGNTDQPTAQCAVLTITGSNVANGYSLISSSILNIGVELNNIGSGTQPYTIDFGSAGNNEITGCSGVIDFSGNNAFANAQNFGGSFQFDGPVYGDSHLQRSQGTGQSPYEYGALSSSQQIYTRYTSLVRVTTSANVTGITLSVGGGGESANNRQQTLTIINSGSGTITFAQASSNVAGGAANTIAPNCAATYVWNNDATLWYPASPPPPASDLSLAPSGANGETFPRQYAAAYFSGLVSEQPYVSAIKLTAGIPVTNITLEVGGAAWTLADVTHGWYALADSGLVVRGVTADQTSGNWGSTFTPVPLALGTPYTPVYTGFYLVVFCATFTGSSGEFPALPAPLGGVAALAPILAGTSGSASSTTPPSLGSTMSALTAVAADRFYAYTS